MIFSAFYPYFSKQNYSITQYRLGQRDTLRRNSQTLIAAMKIKFKQLDRRKSKPLKNNEISYKHVLIYVYHLAFLLHIEYL